MSGALRTTFTIQPLACVVAILVTAAIAFFLSRRFDQPLPAILIAGLAAPTLVLLAALYAIVKADSDGPSPGEVLLAVLPVIGVTAVITLAVSGAVVSFARS